MASAKLIGDKLVCQDGSGITQQTVSAANNNITNLTVNGTLQVGSAAVLNTTLAVSGTTDSTSNTTGAAVFSGGVGVAKKFWCDQMYLNTPVTKCLSLMGSAKLPTSQGPTQVVFQSYWIGWGFAPLTGVYIYNSIVVPSDWIIGTPINVDISWCPDSTNTGNVGWSITFDIFNFTGQVIDAVPQNTCSVLATAPGVAYQTCDSMLTTTPINASAITTPNPLVFMRISRSASDSFTGNAILCGWNMRYSSRNL